MNNMKNKNMILTTVFLSLLMILQPVSVVQVQAQTVKPIGGVVKTMMGSDAKTLNPLFWGSVYDLEIIGYIYESLVGTDINNEYVPLISTGWNYLPDEMAIVFDLNEGMVWHDGTPFDADDVAFTINDIYIADFADNGVQDVTRNSWLFEWTYNATVLSPTKVKIFFSYAPKLADILVEVGLSWILPEHIWGSIALADLGTYTNDNPIGSGPFTFGVWEKGQFFRLDRNPDYYRDGPYIETKIVEIIREIETGYYKLSTGDLQILGAVPPELEAIALNDPNIQIHTVLDDFWLYLGLNQRRYPNNVKEFRQAVLTGVDKQEIIDVARYGRGAVMPASGSLSWGPYYNPNVASYDYDPVAANASLDAIGFVDNDGDGYREDANGTKLAFDLLVSSDFETSINTGKLIVEYMGDIGIDVTLVPLLFDNIWDLTGGSGSGLYDYDWVYIGWALFWSDRHSGWADWLYSANGYWGGTVNMPGWQGAAYDQMTNLTEMIKFETDEATIKELLDEVQVLAAEELPYLPINIDGGVSLFRTDMFDGWLYGNVSGPNNFWSFLNIWQKDVDAPVVSTYVTTIDGVETTIFSTIAPSSGFELLVAFTAASIVAIISVKNRKRN